MTLPSIPVRAEKRALQAVLAIACLVPLLIGAEGVLKGPGFLGHPAVIPVDLDSHFRYISGIFLGVGIAYTTCIADIETKGERFRMLGLFCILGGLSRLYSMIEVGIPSNGHLFGLAMELGVVPLMILWQMAFARRWLTACKPFAADSSPDSEVDRGTDAWPMHSSLQSARTR